MSGYYPFADDINLCVTGRIASEDAERQTRTAKAILRRLENTPGLILADEVGMGKTFVSLAVAVSVALADKESRPVVVMIPPSLKEKWPRDFNVFQEKCLSPDVRKKLRCGIAERTVQFLKFLDDPPEKRKSLIFLTHGAMSRGLSDGWVKLALIQRALKRRRDVDKLKRALCRAMGGLLQMRWVESKSPDVWEVLLNSNTKKWLKILKQHDIPIDDDDPVPLAADVALVDMDATDVFEALQSIPLRKSDNYDARLTEARRTINNVMKDVWKKCIRSVNIKSPLLILDEAHHLKNARTELASLFQVDDAKADADEISRGPLGGVFERMLFLTATPFQLGHHELCSVLNRFEGVAWTGEKSPVLCQNTFRDKIQQLHDALNEAQEAGLRLDNAWGTLSQSSLIVNGQHQPDVATWWKAVRGGGDVGSEVRNIAVRYEQVKEKMGVAQSLLKPWVIRHQREKRLPEPYENVKRRVCLPGMMINREQLEPDGLLFEQGIKLSEDTLLPFLLAARASALKPQSRPVFAEGLASCYEAFMYTRMRREHSDELQQRESLTDQDDEVCHPSGQDKESHWYLDNLEGLIQNNNMQMSISHPKIAATVARAVSLWEKGEKVLIFCHYISAGRVLRQHISESISKKIVLLASKKLQCAESEAMSLVERIGDRFFDQDALVRKACDREVSILLKSYKSLSDKRDMLLDVARRYLRTPSFLVRYFPLKGDNLTVDDVLHAFESEDASGLSITKLLTDFFDFLANRCGANECNDYIEAINRLQTGTHRADDVTQSFSTDETERQRDKYFDQRKEILMPNVRLVNGSTKQDTRQRLMLAFNTPFYPEVLIASSVLAEGVDLHLNCRYVIHHDLSWNPSTLEQRTGRVDRIGAKVERCGLPIHLYFPYIAETQDEKMYRVVMDRERWFNVVMGGKYKVDALTTETLAERVPFPESAAEELSFKLEV